MGDCDRIAVRLCGAGKTYPDGLKALEPIHLTVQAGEFVTLIGPSGCGKSTLLRMVAGLSAPAGGTVELWTTQSLTLEREPESGSKADTGEKPWVPAFAGTTEGSSFRRMPESGASRTAFVFQQPTLMPWASVARNVRLPLDLAGMNAGTRVDEALDLVGLADFANAYPRQLSGGMQMRVSIARALVIEPRLLLMDEPFGALDEITRNRLDHDVRELWARHRLTVLFVTHSIYEAVFLSTRVLVMSPRPGRIAGELRLDPAQPRDEAFRQSARFADWCNRLSTMLASAAHGNASA
ncbi:MAG: ABC transporter ATP-binding protein [Burkholderiales bacterium]|nr:ABC transporter ATP-binding protein [Burkholderiales bacterium]